jgi:hypothetical protein
MHSPAVVGLMTPSSGNKNYDLVTLRVGVAFFQIYMVRVKPGSLRVHDEVEVELHHNKITEITKGQEFVPLVSV